MIKNVLPSCYFEMKIVFRKIYVILDIERLIMALFKDISLCVDILFQSGFSSLFTNFF